MAPSGSKKQKKKSEEKEPEGDPCGSGPWDPSSCEQFVLGPGAPGCEEFLPEDVEPITCPYQKALLQSMRFQGIMMQQMKEEMQKNRQVFKVYLRPTPQVNRDREEKRDCTGNLDVVEDLLTELTDDLEKVRCEYNVLQEENYQREQAEASQPECNCGLVEPKPKKKEEQGSPHPCCNPTLAPCMNMKPCLNQTC